jgi:hypothetical protein
VGGGGGALERDWDPGHRLHAIRCRDALAHGVLRLVGRRRFRRALRRQIHVHNRPDPHLRPRDGGAGWQRPRDGPADRLVRGRPGTGIDHRRPAWRTPRAGSGPLSSPPPR